MEITATIRRVSGVTANVSRPGNISTTVTRIGGSGTSDYEELENKPSINGVELVGDKSTADLLIDVGVTSVNGNTGDVTLNIPTVPTDVSAFNNDAQYVNASQAAAAAPVQSVNGSTGAVTISPKIVYATCSTISTTAAKEATIVSGTLDTLTAGDQVIVYFTASNAAGSPTLKVGNTAAKSIMRYEAVTPGSTVSASWNAQSPVMFVYDGT